MKKPKSHMDELDEFLNASTLDYRKLMRGLAASIARGDNKHPGILKNLEIKAQQSMALADLMARRRVLMFESYALDKVRAAQRIEIYATSVSDIVPNAPFQAAVDALVARTPKLLTASYTALQAYADRAFVVAQSASLTVTAKVHQILVDALQLGLSQAEAVENLLDETEGWTRGYANTVYRTNVARAYADGEKTQGMSEVSRKVFPAWQYMAVNDPDTRPNHRAANGLIAAKTDPIWNSLYPPLGFNCRCTTREKDVYDLEAEGRLSLTGQVIPFYPSVIGLAGRDDGFAA
jgi:SPP1 gp7 family putative phage head morphogenesis protein